MPDDWPGHPQRKDYPLGGIPVEYKGAHDPAAGPAEGVQLMTTHDHDALRFESLRDPTTHDASAPATRTATSGADEWPPRAPSSSTPPAATGTTSSTRPTALHEERIVVNMGPQHPSTHGVLRLILELDGETVTEARAGIGYLHTGIEKNMEFRTWTQGVTFCTRMDYLTPMFQEAAYCLAVEKLLGITDQIPERASHHPRADDGADPDHLPPRRLGTGGMEMGATTVMTVGFRERERILRDLRDDHRPADEQRLHPPRRRGAGPARAALSTRSATWSPQVRRGLQRARAAAQREPDPQGPHRRRRLPRPHRLHGAGHHRPGAARRPACRTTCARRSPTAATRPTTSTSSPATRCDAYGRLRIRIDEMYESLQDRRAGHRPAPGRRARPPVMVEDKKIAWPAQLAIGGDGMGNSLDHIREIMGTSMESPDPPLQAGHRGLPGPAGPGLRRGRVAPRASSAATSCPTAAPAPTGRTSATRRFNNLQAVAAMCEGGQVADVIVAVASIDPVMGGVDR